MEFVKVKDQKSLREALEVGKIPIWAGDESLYFALEAASEGINQRAKYNIKSCRDITFSKSVKYIKDGKFITEFTNLADFLQSMGTLIDDNDIFNVTSNDYVEVFELIQQFINLGCSPNVYTEEDLVKKDTVSKFLNISDQIKTQLKLVSEFLNNQFYNEFESSKKFLYDKISQIDSALSDSAYIKMAVFASKKTGKSMVVNCILGDEYAPTSLEIPTPSNIIYKPIAITSSQREIVLRYDDKTYKFDSPHDTKRYLKEIFKEVTLSGKKLPDMIIEYPPKSEIHFEIIDTPGPDLAGSEHKAGIDQIIRNCDIAVFIIDYSKYAQESEIELFKSVKEYFEKIEKQYSFICLINKYDLAFQDADTEKIVVRVSDFIREKLKNLGFNCFVVIPISALTWFYLTQIEERFPEIRDKEQETQDNQDDQNNKDKDIRR